MSQLDGNLIRRISKKGDRVFHLHYDSGIPGGADCDEIYKFQDVYWANSSSWGFSGPYKSLDEALRGFAVTSATDLVYCNELTAAELAERLEVLYDEDAEPEQLIVKINDEKWRITKDGKLTRARSPHRDSGERRRKKQNLNQGELPLG